jgi:hypothetical protein
METPKGPDLSGGRDGMLGNALIYEWLLSKFAANVFYSL